MKASWLGILLTSAAELATLSGCTAKSTDEESLGKIWNGIEIDEEEVPAVRMLNQSCTGTFISDRVYLTAGHCIPGLRASTDKWPPRVRVKGTDQKTFNVWPHEKFVNPDVPENKTSWLDMGRYDVAVLAWNESVTSDFIPVATGDLSLPVAIEIVGYGGTDYGGMDARKKHKGTNQLEGRRFDMLELVVDPDSKPETKGTPAIGTNGDSGGPMLADRKLIGITSWGRTNHPALLGDKLHHEFYVDVRSRIVIDFLKKVEAAGYPIEWAK